jgi:hypothetical protein
MDGELFDGRTDRHDETNSAFAVLRTFLKIKESATALSKTGNDDFRCVF